MTCSVVIPNFNGANLLTENLPFVLELNADEVIVLDDGSKDTSKEALAVFGNRIKTIFNPVNLGYGETVNKGFKAAQGEIVLLLNTDVRPAADVLHSLLPHFDNAKTFAVSCHEQGTGFARGWFKDGYLYHEAGPETNQAHVSLWASGGSAAFRKQTFINLGSYDEIYKPFYWEDTDISYRAWKQGYEIWWEPKALMEHARSSTIKKYFSKSFVDYIVQRNELIFLWKNITDEQYLAQNKKAVIDRIMKGPGYLRPVLGAWMKRGIISERLKQEKPLIKKTDYEIFAQFSP